MSPRADALRAPTERILAPKVAQNIRSASWIREMFERGRRLKAELGEAAVCDFSLGNPTAPPPPEFFDALQAVAAEHKPELHRYMPNAGFEETRAAVARFLATEYGVEFTSDSILMTSGAAGGLNVALRAICEPGDEVIVFAPFFPEYRFYAEQAGARLVIVQSDEAFQPDIAGLEKALTPRARAVIVNSPNNPSGALLTEARCGELAEVLRRHDRPGCPLYLLLDDPYRRLVFDTDRGPSPLSLYARSLLISSYSKDLSVPGERLGYVAVPPSTPGRELLLGGMTMLNRTLGFVNASAFMQRVIARCASACCDVDYYRKRRDALCRVLRDAGYAFERPAGGMFCFPRTPIADDVRFIDLLSSENVLAVPGSGFGRPGHMRLSFGVGLDVIERSASGLARALRKARDI